MFIDRVSCRAHETMNFSRVEVIHGVEGHSSGIARQLARGVKRLRRGGWSGSDLAGISTELFPLPPLATTPPTAECRSFRVSLSTAVYAPARSNPFMQQPVAVGRNLPACRAKQTVLAAAAHRLPAPSDFRSDD